MTPGEMVFTRTGEKSIASPRVSPSIAALIAETSAAPGDGLWPSVPETAWTSRT